MNKTFSILIVDDEPNLRLMFRTTLTSEGYRVAEVSDGAQCLEKLRRSPADLVLLDLQMPGMGGMEVLRQLREEGNLVPVVIVTAHGSVPDAVAAMQLGAIDFLSKPVTPDGLRQAVAKVITRRSRPESGRVEETFEENLQRARRALNRREFDQAETYLDRAIALDGRSEEARSLWATLRRCKTGLGSGPYPILRELCW